jgi:glucose-6-phosphate isomerase
VNAQLEAIGKRLFAGDASLWPADAAAVRNRLGWLSVIEPMRAQAGELRAFAEEIRAAGYRRALLLGMGGSSLCPEVLRRSFGVPSGATDLRVLDSTVPAAVLEADAWSREAKTLFIVASKSGTTIEIQSFARTFASRGAEHFVAITDPKTALEAQARREGFRRVFLNPADIGGRYSALSFFGMVPAALLGIDVEKFLTRAADMARADGPAVELGGLLHEAQARGRDKLTLVLEPPVESLGSWIEQLVAESLGKEELGILPVDGETPGEAHVYGPDRLFACLGCGDEARRLARSGLAVIRFSAAKPEDLGREFLRWEIATAVAGALMKVNPFDEPNVRESKEATAAMLAGGFPDEAPVVEESGVRLYADPRLEASGGLREWLTAHLGRARPGDYVAWLAYLPRTGAIDAELQAMRRAVRDRMGMATTIGYGPRYLHSTGQIHKGGPNTGVFLMITADDAAELPIPGEPYGFARLKQAQALGDFVSLARRERRVVRCHLAGDALAGLRALRGHVEAIVASPATG